MLPRRLFVAGFLLAASSVVRAQSVAQSGSLAAHQQVARDVYQQLVEMNTTDGVGSTTIAAEAVAKRFRDAGFPAADVQVLGPRVDKGNIVVRYRGSGAR